MYFGKVKDYVFQILLINIPNSLGDMLTNLLKKDGLSNNYTPGDLVDVYDIINAGPRNRFTVLGTSTNYIASNCQSTGHDCLVFYVDIVENLLKEEKIEFKWIVADWHDQCIVEVDPKDAERVKYLMGTKAYDILNQDFLKGEIPLKGDAQIVNNLAEAKLD